MITTNPIGFAVKGNVHLNALSDALGFDIDTLWLREITVGPWFYDLTKWPHAKLDRYIRRLHKIRCNYTLSGVIDDDYSPRRVFDINVQFRDGYFTVDFDSEVNYRRFPPRPVSYILASSKGA